MRLRLQGPPPRFSSSCSSAAAVIVAVVDIDLLNDALPDLSESDVLDAIDLLIPRRVFRETGNAGRVEFVHDLLRELPVRRFDGIDVGGACIGGCAGELLEQRRAKGQAVAAADSRPSTLRSKWEDLSRAFRLHGRGRRGRKLEAYAFNNAIGQLTEAL